ncbi:DUF3631 domain-containing protein [Paraburkholderia nemoris]|uniref:DUF3631 domain-containing protein n=1 Tax=Paraburkholderia nemoris TaxID=2793076 RepID=UPI0038BC55A1
MEPKFLNIINPEPGEESGAPVPANPRKPLPSGNQTEAKQDAVRSDTTSDCGSKVQEVAVSADTAEAAKAAATEVADAAISGAALLDETSDTLDDFVKLETHQREAVVLWLLASRCKTFKLVSPVLYFSAPGKGCGKTKALGIVSKLVRNPVKASIMTAASLYRAILARGVDGIPPTLMLDNAHLHLREDARMAAIISGSFADRDFACSIISGYRDGMPEGIDVFSTWCDKVLAGNGELSADLMDCSIVIKIQRKKPDQTIRQVAYENPERFAELRRKIDHWLEDNESPIQAELRKVSDGRNNRLGDKWATMLAIARVAGGGWHERAKRAMSLIECKESPAQDISELVALELQRYFRVHGGTSALTRDIVAWMNSDPESPWPHYNEHGKPFRMYDLRRVMQDHGVYSVHVGPRNTRWRGYKLSDLQGLFESYPLPEGEFAREGDQV